MKPFRDWPRTLRPASYGGATFYVEADDIETGRRLEVHEFPHGNEPYVEDLGRKANLITVTAYVLSDQADAEEKSLRRACESGGAKLLSLPIERLRAHCETCRRTFERDRMGYIAFELSFVREGRGAGLVPIGFLSAVVENLAGQMLGAVTAAFESSYRGLRVPSFVRDAAITDIAEVAATVETIAATGQLRDGYATALARGAGWLFRGAETLARSGFAGHAYSQTSYRATSETKSAAPLAETLYRLARLSGRGAAGESLTTLDPLITFRSDVTVASTGWLGVQETNSAAIGRVVRAGVLAGIAERVAQTRYTERRDAIQARADVAELIDVEVSRLDAGRDHAVARALADISGRTAEYLSRQVADLAPIIIVDAERRMPALWWAQRMYGTADRAGELVTRNGVKHAGFMPLSFEAKSA